MLKKEASLLVQRGFFMIDWAGRGQLGRVDERLLISAIQS